MIIIMSFTMREQLVLNTKQTCRNYIRVIISALYEHAYRSAPYDVEYPITFERPDHRIKLRAIPGGFYNQAFIAKTDYFAFQYIRKL
ncbi:hypothetical protein SDC9_127188 [bioreactor metagenome]|uniref:Uncharacterized protein n=1 Tax=bioreactor metagenome TaxID=1076179 RepID=A0A645CTX1_9ZZZZ